MTHSKREKPLTNNKDTRWDRIRKRHCNNTATALKSEAVKRFIEIDYIGKHQQNILNGDIGMENKLDPVLVMDLRHEMVSFCVEKTNDTVFVCVCFLVQENA